MRPTIILARWDCYCACGQKAVPGEAIGWAGRVVCCPMCDPDLRPPGANPGAYEADDAPFPDDVPVWLLEDGDQEDPDFFDPNC